MIFCYSDLNPITQFSHNHLVRIRHTLEDVGVVLDRQITVEAHRGVCDLDRDVDSEIADITTTLEDLDELPPVVTEVLGAIDGERDGDVADRRPRTESAADRRVRRDELVRDVARADKCHKHALAVDHGLQLQHLLIEVIARIRRAIEVDPSHFKRIKNQF